MARHFHKQTGRKVTLKVQFLLCCKIKYVYILYTYLSDLSVSNNLIG